MNECESGAPDALGAAAPLTACPRCGYERLPVVDAVRRCPECALEMPVDAVCIATRSPIALLFTTPWVLVAIGVFWVWVLVRLGMVAGWFPLASGVFWILVFVAGFWWAQRRRAARADRGGPVLVVGAESIDWWAAGASRRTMPWSRVRSWSLRPFGFGRRVPDGQKRWALTLRAGRTARWPRLVIEATPARLDALRDELRRRAPASEAETPR